MKQNMAVLFKWSAIKSQQYALGGMIEEFANGGIGAR